MRYRLFDQLLKYRLVDILKLVDVQAALTDLVLAEQILVLIEAFSLEC